MGITPTQQIEHYERTIENLQERSRLMRQQRDKQQEEREALALDAATGDAVAKASVRELAGSIRELSVEISDITNAVKQAQVKLDAARAAKEAEDRAAREKLAAAAGLKLLVHSRDAQKAMDTLVKALRARDAARVELCVHLDPPRRERVDHQLFDKPSIVRAARAAGLADWLPLTPHLGTREQIVSLDQNDRSLLAGVIPESVEAA